MHWHLLTRQSIDQWWPFVIIFLLWDGAVLPVHLADRSGAFSGDVTLVIFVKQHLIHQVRLYQVWFCRRFRGAIVVAFEE